MSLFQWNESTHARLSALAAEGLTARAIAEALSAWAGVLVSRNTVIGRARRNGIKLRSMVNRPRPKGERAPLPVRLSAPRRAEPPPPPPRPRSVEIKYQPVPLIERSAFQCAFIEGPVSHPAMCCGQPVRGLTSWCETHARRVYSRAAIEEMGL